MRTVVRDHVVGAAAVLTIGSLALIFAAVLGRVPGGLPRAPVGIIEAIPHVNAAISVGAIVVIASGWRWIRRGNVRRHRAAMATATVFFAAFLTLYLYRVTLVGPTPFDGPDALFRWLYLPVLAIHISLAIVCIPLLYYVLLVGVTHSVPAIRRTRHRTVGRIAAPLWLVSFALGIVVYLLLYVVF